MIHFVSYGITNGAPPPHDLLIDCLDLPDPSPVVHDLPGFTATTAEVIMGMNDLVDSWLQLAANLIYTRAKITPSFTVAFACSAGVHRSPFAAEHVAAMMRRAGLEVAVVHRDLEVTP
ncbi:RapZ C-terminal domain-containing protein [Corynebacterium bouchesdurhonense]|uniref:RapZ C-terminal domain-containing protein n=1 Tax=Corynebacterium bouchesdurhonense TaxID=1720192 RepID=UPI00082D3AB3|nr:RNase adapter RapZ [Corynebacterium bouchesdurhonense]